MEKGPKREMEKLKNSLTMMAFITCGFCIAAASSGSFMIFAIMSAGVTPSSYVFGLICLCQREKVVRKRKRGGGLK